MKLSELISVELIEADLKSKNKTDVLEEMLNLLIKAGRVDQENKEEIFEAIMDRENIRSTGIGLGVGLPHAKTPIVKEIVACFGRSKEGINFKSSDEKPVHLIFLLLASDNNNAPYIDSLSQISRLLKNNYIREMLTSIESAEKILDFIKREEAKLL